MERRLKFSGLYNLDLSFQKNENTSNVKKFLFFSDNIKCKYTITNSPYLNLLCLSFLHLLCCNWPAKNLNSNYIQNNEFETASDKSSYCWLLVIKGKIIENSGFYRPDTEDFYHCRPKTLYKRKMPNNSHVSKRKPQQEEAKSMHTIVFYLNALHMLKYAWSTRFHRTR